MASGGRKIPTAVLLVERGLKKTTARDRKKLLYTVRIKKFVLYCTVYNWLIREGGKSYYGIWVKAWKSFPGF